MKLRPFAARNYTDVSVAASPPVCNIFLNEARMDRTQAAQVISRLRELLAQKTSLEATGKAVGLGTTKVRKLADLYEIPRRKRFSPEKRKQVRADIREAKHTFARLAQIHACAKSTISDYARKLTDESGGEFRPHAIRKKRVCPTCGFAIRVWPCVACAARGIQHARSSLAN